MGQKSAKEDFEWSFNEEPHKTRRKQILEKYPDIKKLMVHDSWLKYKVFALVLCQSISLVSIRNQPWWLVMLAAYIWGGTWNHALALAIHEISHNHAFGYSRPMLNKILGMFANLPMGLPYSVSFRKYHLDHHKYQGDEKLDVDIPSKFEVIVFKTKLLKLLWVCFQPFFYAGRPLIINPKPLEKLELINVFTQLIFNYLVYRWFGFSALAYLISGTILAMGLHPMAGHFIAEHYVFKKGSETYSYYGPLNLIAFNVGYHNEHHDFPNIPGCLLPAVKTIAPEYYDNLPQYTSWTWVLWKFVTDDNICLYSRVKRKSLHS